jgi:hypothetical protein
MQEIRQNYPETCKYFMRVMRQRERESASVCACVRACVCDKSCLRKNWELIFVLMLLLSTQHEVFNGTTEHTA